MNAGQRLKRYSFKELKTFLVVLEGEKKETNFENKHDDSSLFNLMDSLHKAFKLCDEKTLYESMDKI